MAYMSIRSELFQATRAAIVGSGFPATTLRWTGQSSPGENSPAYLMLAQATPDLLTGHLNLRRTALGFWEQFPEPGPTPNPDPDPDPDPGCPHV